MAEYRPIKNKIWHDEWFLSLTSEEKLFWIFILTNEYVHISGIYELPKPLISPLTGVSEWQKIIDKFVKDGKIEYKDGFIYIRNYLKNQTKQISKKDNIFKAILAYLQENPKLVELFNLKKEAPYKSLISPLLDPSESIKGLKDESIKEESIKVLAGKPADEINQVFEIFYKINPTLNWGNKTQRKAVQQLIQKLGLDKTLKIADAAVAVYSRPFAPVITTPYQLKEKLSQLVAFYQKNNQSKTLHL